jgi:hypothetical protein
MVRYIWKPLHALEVLAVRMPARYHQTPAGQWRCPPGEAYAESLGLTYRVRSSARWVIHRLGREHPKRRDCRRKS